MRPPFVIALLGVLTGLAMVPGGSVFAQGHAPAATHATHASAPHTEPASATAGTPAADGVVNINAASEEELTRLPGIGPSRAAAIVALRQRVQHFRAVDDLVRVRGIGHASLRRLRPYLTLMGATTLAARPGHAPRARAADANAPDSGGGGDTP